VPTNISYLKWALLNEYWTNCLREDNFYAVMSYTEPQTNPQVDKLAEVQGQLDEVKIIMNDNLAKAINRGERIDDMLIQSERLEESGNRFWNGARQVRRKFQCQNYRQTACISSVVIILIVIVSIIIWSQTKN
jgi:hypothetical protein